MGQHGALRHGQSSAFRDRKFAAYVGIKTFLVHVDGKALEGVHARR
jgi:hypothetical protein